MRPAIALASFSIVTLLGCASGNDDNGTTSDAATDSGAHDTALADTAVPDAPKDSTADVADAHETASEVGSDSTTTDSASETAADSGSDVVAETAMDSGVDTAADSVVADSALDSALDVTDVVVLGYRHTIVIDGTNDFTATSERFDTTSGASSGYFAYVTWDDVNLYLGYDGSDVGSTAASTKWLFAYFDVDPGASTGSSTGETYNTETPAFPSGFLADYYLRWQSKGSGTSAPIVSLKAYSASTSSWSDVVSTITWKASGTYVEMSLPLVDLGSPSKPGLVTFWMNEAAGVEASYAGLYSGNFTDAYHASLPITHWLSADFASPLAPNDPSNEK